MGYGRIIFTMIGFSASFFFGFSNLRRWQKRQKQQAAEKKLRVVNEALELAEERAEKFQQRHDLILSQISSHYLSHQDLEEALAGARVAMNEALEFAVRLREMQIKILIIFPDEADLSILDRS